MAPDARPPDRLLNRNFIATCLVNFTGWAAGYALLATLALYAVGLGVPAAHVGWFPATASAFGLVGQVSAGRLQAWPQQTLLLRVPTLLMAAASLLMVAAPGVVTLVVVCALFGLGYGVLQNTAIVLATEAAPPARRGQAIGLYGTFTTLAVLIAPATGIAILQRFGGESVFALTAALAVATFGCTLLVRAPARRAAARAQRREPLHPLVFFAAVALFGMTATWGTIVTYMPLYAMELGLQNPGWFFTVQAVAVITLRAVAGGLSDRLGRIQVLVPATLVVAVAMWGMALHPAVPVLLALALLHGWGYSAFHPTTIALADDVSTPQTRGSAFALVGSAFSVGQGGGGLVMGYVLAATSYETMFAVAGCIPLVATGLCVWRWLAYPELRHRAG